MTATRFPIRFGPVSGAFLWLLGLRRSAYVEVGDEAIHVRMGYGFRAAIPRSSIVALSEQRRIPWGWGIGVHGWRGSWVVNGTLRDIVHLEISPPARGRVLGVPVKPANLWVSLEDPAGFRAAIGR